MNKSIQNTPSPRAKQLSEYNIARINLLIAVGTTLINVILALTNADIYFLFSAFIPYYLVVDGMFCCGKMPDYWYEGDKSEYLFYDTSYLAIMIAFAVTIIALYFIFWMLSKNQRSGWMIAALVLFSIDSLAFLWLGGISLESILDIAFHIFVLYYLIAGIIAAHKLKTLPPDEEEVAAEKEGVEFFPETVLLKGGKQKEAVGANYFRGKEGVGGTLNFYNDRIVFKSHAFNIQTGNTTILYADMTTTKAQKNLGISNGLLIYTTDGSEHRFVVNSRDHVMSFIDKKILACKNQAKSEPEEHTEE